MPIQGLMEAGPYLLHNLLHEPRLCCSCMVILFVLLPIPFPLCPVSSLWFLMNVQHTTLHPGIFWITHHSHRPWIYQLCELTKSGSAGVDPDIITWTTTTPCKLLLNGYGCKKGGEYTEWPCCVGRLYRPQNRWNRVKYLRSHRSLLEYFLQ